MTMILGLAADGDESMGTWLKKVKGFGFQMVALLFLTTIPLCVKATISDCIDLKVNVNNVHPTVDGFLISTANHHLMVYFQ